MTAVYIIAGFAIAVFLWGWWEVRHAIDDPSDSDPAYVPEEWDWPAEDVSEVRHRGLGR